MIFYRRFKLVCLYFIATAKLVPLSVLYKVFPARIVKVRMSAWSMQRLLVLEEAWHKDVVCCVPCKDLTMAGIQCPDAR